MRASRNARPSGGTSNVDLVRTPGLPVKHGHVWHTGSRHGACERHEVRVASSDATVYTELARELGAGYEATAAALARARRTCAPGECAYTVALEALAA